MLKSFINEFREFAVRGNVVDLAVGIIIGGAFGKIVSSLVADVVMPPIGIIVGGVNFTNLKITLKDAVNEKIPAVTLNYGQFIQAVVDFTIVAFAVFLLVKAINTLKRKQDEAPPQAPPPSDEVVLLKDIRDILKQRP